ncbi:MAG: PKD domain-containing protein [Chitinophagaceae bacterium]|nr:PKD domain-containing protein [Chitinophagaceae bacterium]
MRKIISTLILILAGVYAHACGSINLTQTSGNTFNFSFTPFSGTVVQYNWLFGDGGTSTASNPTHTYANTGYYAPCVTLTIVDSGFTYTCTVCDSLFAQASSSCYATYSYTISAIGGVSFTGFGTGPGTILGYMWDFGDGTTSTVQNPTHVYPGPGLYNCCLTIFGVDSMQNPYTCTYCDSIQIGSLVTPCMANFMWTNTGLTASFMDMSSAPGPISNYNWTFGDGGTSTLQNPTHTYASSGSYNVCLTISGIDSMSNPFSCTYCDSTVYVSNTTCNASYNYNFVGSTFYFTNTSVVSGTIIGYNWSFGDGGTSTVANPIHTYTTSGFMNVCLTITVMNAGTVSTCTSCSMIYVNAASGPCNANYSYVQSTGTTINFTNTSTAGGTINSYAWTFGDGGTSSAQNPTHTYGASGYYNVCLTISGIDSNQQTFTCTHCDSVYVQGTSTGCNITANFTKTTSGNTAMFTNTTNCTGCTSISYNWNFGDASTSTLTNPNHIYASSGTYTVCLTATGIASGTTCVDTSCYTVIVGSSNVNDVVKEQLQVYPNPSQDVFHIILPDTKTYELKVVDMAGRTIVKNDIQSASKTYSLQASTLSNGIYHLSISGNDKIMHTRIIKQ